MNLFNNQIQANDIQIRHIEINLLLDIFYILQPYHLVYECELMNYAKL